MKGKIEFVFDFWDCPRKGISEIENKFYYFECLFDPQEDEYSDQFRLKEINRNTIDIVTEIERIKSRWDNKIVKTKEDKSTFPVLPVDLKKYYQLSQELERDLKISERNSFLRIGRFTKIEYMTTYEVYWQQV